MGKPETLDAVAPSTVDKAELVRRLSTVLPPACLLHAAEDLQAVRVRRPDCLSPAAAGRGAARGRGAGARCPAHLSRGTRTGGRTRRRHRAVGRGHAARAGRDARPVEDEAHSRDRSGRAHRARAARCAQPGDLRSGRSLRPVLRARPFQPDRLFHRRQRRGELRRRALPEVRPDRAQHAQAARRDHRGRDPGDRLRWPGCAGLRSARLAHRLRRTARRGHDGDHGQAAAQTGEGAGRAGRVRLGAQGGRGGGQHHRAPASSRPAWR